mmetsp:Transcript_41894/g.57127  ORF Transcript_41894/g.57127 Transcript_41894/m.57127 type:complete len:86 (-) Transcript_41894:13-270(-)
MCLSFMVPSSRRIVAMRQPIFHAGGRAGRAIKPPISPRCSRGGGAKSSTEGAVDNVRRFLGGAEDSECSESQGRKEVGVDEGDDL